MVVTQSEGQSHGSLTTISTDLKVGSADLTTAVLGVERPGTSSSRKYTGRTQSTTHNTDGGLEPMRLASIGGENSSPITSNKSALDCKFQEALISPRSLKIRLVRTQTDAEVAAKGSNLRASASSLEAARRSQRVSDRSYDRSLRSYHTIDVENEDSPSKFAIMRKMFSVDGDILEAPAIAATTKAVILKPPARSPAT
eukprot:gene45770-57032_t